MHVGLDRIALRPELAAEVKGKRVALLAHPASIDKNMRHASVVLRECGAEIVRYFGPEHGFGGEAQDMIGVADARAHDGKPIKSLYGDSEDALVPKAVDLEDIDVLVIDLQDVGARYYTFIWTAVLALRGAARLGKKTLVLDRPNPIGKDLAQTEGKLQQSERYHSFVGLEAIPVRHGLSLGEIVAWRASVERLPADALKVIGVRDVIAVARGWDRPFVPPSPNMPSYETTLVYPGACLIEGTNLSEGRGTTRPFEMFGAPWLDGPALAAAFEKLSFPGVAVRPCTFFPMFHKHAQKNCGGVFVHVTDEMAFRPMASYLALITLAHAQDPKSFRFRTESYEFREDVPAFDLLTGGPSARESILRGDRPADVAESVATAGERERALVLGARAAASSFLER